MNPEKKRINNKLLSSFVYYLRALRTLYRLPIRLRLVDIEKMANDIKAIREISDQECEEWIAFLKTYIKEEEV